MSTNLSSLPIEASPLLCFLYNKAKLLIGHFTIIGDKKGPLWTVETKVHIKHSAIIMQPGKKDNPHKFVNQTLACKLFSSHTVGHIYLAKILFMVNISLITCLNNISERDCCCTCYHEFSPVITTSPIQSWPS